MADRPSPARDVFDRIVNGIDGPEHRKYYDLTPDHPYFGEKAGTPAR
jgi:hypothetical protein